MTDRAADRREWSAGVRRRDADDRASGPPMPASAADAREQAAAARDREADERDRTHAQALLEQAEIDREVRASARSMRDADVDPR